MTRPAAHRLARYLRICGYRVRVGRFRPRRGPAYYLVERAPARAEHEEHRR